MFSRFVNAIGSFALVTGSLTLLSTSASASEAVPLSEYGKLPDVERSAISPSGDRVAVITTIKGKRVILAIEDQTTPIKIVSVGDMKVRSIRWVGEDRLLLTTSKTQDLYGFTTDKTELDIGRVIPIADDTEAGIIFGNVRKLVDSMRGFYGIREIDGRHYGFFGGIELGRDSSGRRSSLKFRHGRPFLFKVDMTTFETEKVAGAAREGFGKDWLVDADGKIA